MKTRTLTLGLMFAGLLVTSIAGAEEWEFSADVDRIIVNTTSGDVIVRPAEGNQGWVELTSSVRPADAFEPRVVENKGTLKLDERWHGGSSNGRVEWTIYIPDGDEQLLLRVKASSSDFDCRGVTARMDVSSASGDLSLSEIRLGPNSELSTASGDVNLDSMNLTGDVRISSASGDIELTDIILEEGAEISTASGDIDCRRCEGTLDLSAASGDVVVRNSTLVGESELSSASGSVSVHLKSLPVDGLAASSASGNVLLDVEDFGDQFTLVMIKREDRGRISCPFDYTSENTFESHHLYEEKVVERGSGGPEIELRTASGSVVVRD